MPSAVLKGVLVSVVAILSWARRTQAARVNVAVEREFSSEDKASSVKMASSRLVASSRRQVLSEEGAFAGGPSHVDAETTILVRECVMQRAQDWADLHERLGVDYSYLHGNSSRASPAELVELVFNTEDKVAARSASRNILQRWLHWDSRSSHMRKWSKIEENVKAELKSWGFDVEASRARCAKGMTEQAYTCMLDKACGKVDCPTMKQDIRRRIDLRDLVVHFEARRNWWNSRSEEENDLWTKIADMTAALKAHRYEWTDNKLECRKFLHKETERLKKRTLTELSAGEKVNDVCQETPDKMCPEGTYATEKRRWDMARGSAVTGTAFLIAKFTLLPLGSAIGGLFGPMGATAGFVAGNALVAPIAFASGWWASRGPLECGCFPRDCSFNNKTATCQMESHNASTKNPYGPALPLLGMKCALYYKSTDSCGLQQCTMDDYSPTLSDVKMYGTLGHDGTDLFNCLSISRSVSGAVSIADTLPDGQANSVEARNKVYQKVLMQAGKT